MARVNIPVVTILREGVAFGDYTELNPLLGNYFVQPEGGVEIMLVNDSGGSRTITFVSALEVDALTLDDLRVGMLDGGSVLHGGFRRKTFNQDPVDGSVYVDVDGGGVFARAFRFVDAG